MIIKSMINDLNFAGIKHENFILPAPLEAIYQSERHEIARLLALAGAFDTETPLYQGEGGQVLIELKMFLICEFWRQLVDSEFRCCKNLPKVRKSEWFKAEVELWVTVFAMLERMNSLGMLPTLDRLEGDTILKNQPNSPNLWFFLLLKEHGLLMPWFGCFGQTNITPFIKAIQKQNMLMQKLDENPFLGTHANVSRIVIECAMKLSDVSDCFRNQCYTPMVKARGTLAQALRKTGHDSFKVTGSGELEPVFRRNNPIKK